MQAVSIQLYVDLWGWSPIQFGPTWGVSNTHASQAPWPPNSFTPERHDEAHESLSSDRLERLFIYCTTWGLGGLLDVKDRAGFDAELRSFGGNMPPRCAASRDPGGTVRAVAKWEKGGRAMCGF